MKTSVRIFLGFLIYVHLEIIAFIFVSKILNPTWAVFLLFVLILFGFMLSAYKLKSLPRKPRKILTAVPGTLAGTVALISPGFVSSAIGLWLMTSVGSRVAQAFVTVKGQSILKGVVAKAMYTPEEGIIIIKEQPLPESLPHEASSEDQKTL